MGLLSQTLGKTDSLARVRVDYIGAILRTLNKPYTLNPNP